MNKKYSFKILTVSKYLIKILKIFITLSSPFLSNAQPPIGYWGQDEKHLPVFYYNGKIPYNFIESNGQKIDLPPDPWFLLGNYKLTSFVYTTGSYDLICFERAWGKMNNVKNSNAYISINEKQYEITGLNSSYACNATKQFGTGFARFVYNLPDNIEVTRTISVLPSEKINAGLGAIFINISVKNNGNKNAKIKYIEQIGAKYRQIGQLSWVNYTANGEKPHIGLSKINYSFKSEYGIIPKKNEPSRVDINPPLLYQYSNQLCETEQAVLDKTEITSKLSFKIIISPKSTENIHLVNGWAYEDKLKQDLLKIDKLFLNHATDPTFRKDWQQKLPVFSMEKDSILTREMIWNAYNLEAMAKYNSYFEETFIPQGMNYDFQWGLTASIRDLMFYSLPTSYYNKELAKSIIRLSAKMIRPNGAFEYTIQGFGYSSNLTYTPSDLQLDFFWVVANYIKVTADYSILGERTPYYPKGSGQGSLLDKLGKAFAYLRDDINVGPHGLIKVLNGDWNDKTWANYNLNKYIGSAESHYNSALAIYSMYDLIEVLSKIPINSAQKDVNKKAELLQKDLQIFRNQQLNSFMKDLGDRVFPRRIYFLDTLVWGDKSMHAESVAFTLLIPELSKKKKLDLVDLSWNKLLENEKLGPRLSNKPLEENLVSKGTRENAGVWYFTSGVMALGFAEVDKEKSKSILNMMTFNNHALNYPNYWSGYWTNVDANNSSIANYPGLPDNPKAIWNTFPAYCAHAHAFPLYVYFKLNK